MKYNKKYLFIWILISGVIIYLSTVYNYFIDMISVENQNGEIISYNKEVKYPHETLISLPADELYNIFIQNGLVISEDLLEEAFDNQEDDFIEYFKADFELLSLGISNRSDIRYFELSEQVEEIYNEIIIKDNN